MGYTQIPVTIVAGSGLQVDPVSFKQAAGSIRPLVTAESKYVLCCHFINADGSDYPLNSGDTFELGIDTDYISDATEGTLSGSLTAGNAVTSIIAKSGLDTSNVPDTGHIRLYNSSSVMERIEYTAFNSSTLTFTVSHTMVSSYADSDRLVVEDELMAYSGNDVVDVSGDWDDIARASGKISIQIDATADIFKEKLNGTKTDIYLEIRRYPVGKTDPCIMYQDKGYARNTVIDGRSNPATTNLQFLTPTSGDARYELLKQSTQTTITDDATTYITLGAAATYRAFKIEYTLDDGTNFRKGIIDVMHNGSIAYVDEAGSMSIGTISGISFDADIDSGNVRLLVTADSVGSALKMVHKIINTIIISV